ncbi:hypothetical protein [Nitrosomonas communis]|uniref:Uncharacterized protein n=1 Tax=Nitrosomonas communis TaxID=44574 RepID=A0A1I4VQA2_9PROT|nr:hypothetical protein [Nitrosomonas communis]SFN03330.1 hypothetical protein SAMN05421863_10888 [Nitrosomonas communis]
MSLVDLIRKSKNIKIATANYREESKGTVAEIATIAIANTTEPKTDTDSNLEVIRTWLFSIREPEEDHYHVLNKCRNDPKALEYFLKHARGRFESGCTLTDE